MDFVFNGTQDLTIPDFSLGSDRIDFSILANAIASVKDTPAGLVFTTVDGMSLTLGGISLAALATTPLSTLPPAFLVVGTDGADNGLTPGLLGSVMLGRDGADVIFGSVETDAIFGNEGDDFLSGGGGGADHLYGGQGNDGISFGESLDFQIQAVPEGDTLVVGGLGRDTIIGTVSGSARIFGGNEAGSAGDGADLIDVTLTSGASVDIVAGAGSDQIRVQPVFAGSFGKAAIDAGSGNDSIGGAIGNNSVVFGDAGADSISLDAEGQIVVLGGSRLSDAADGADRIDIRMIDNGGDITAQATILGNGGNDLISFSTDGSFTATAFVHGGADTDYIFASDLANGSQIFGGIGSDRVEASVDEGVAAIFGGTGVSSAEDGTDQIEVSVNAVAKANIYGNGGNDMIMVEGEGEAALLGGQGSDILYALGTGQYDATGGVGADTFLFTNSTSEAALSSITDLDFDEDTIVSDGPYDKVTVVSGAADSYDELVALTAVDQSDGRAAALVSVDMGDLSGDYLAYDAEGGLQIIDVTGYSGTINADVFVGQDTLLLA